jgi:hypothetical protein
LEDPVSQPPSEPSRPPQYPDPQQPQGQPPYGQQPYPPAPQGQPPYGPAPQDQPPYGPQQYGPQQPYGQQPGWTQPTAAQYGSDIGQIEAGYTQLYGQKKRTGLAIAAMVLGILGFLCAWWPLLSYLAVVLSILAVIFGLIAMRRIAGRGMAVSGLVLGGIALIGSIWISIRATEYFVDVAQVIVDCQEETNRSSGPAFERCVDSRVPQWKPFG